MNIYSIGGQDITHTRPPAPTHTEKKQTKKNDNTA